MAAAKSAATGAQSTIPSFFKRGSDIPRDRRPEPEPCSEHIAVATPSTSAQNSATRRASATALPAARENVSNKHLPRNRGRACEHPASSEPQSSQSSTSSSGNSNEESGTPPKAESQQQRDDQLLKSSASPPSWPNYNINPLDGTADFASSCDVPHRSASNTPSKRRVVVNVDKSSSPKTESPASTGRMSAAPVSVPRQSKLSSNPVPASSSTSTLTSVSDSQASALPVSSSNNGRRIGKIGKDGMQGVPDSDPDESSDSERLEDLSSFLPNKRRKLSPEPEMRAASSTAAIPASGKKSVGYLDQDKRQKPFMVLPSSPPKKKVKHSLASLAAQHEKDQLESATIASLESAVDNAKLREQQAAAAQDSGIDASAIIEAAGSDSDAQQRMLLSMSRTEALKHDEISYRFFLDDKPLWTTEPFPIDHLPGEPWADLYKDEVSRKHACISGFAAELAAIYPLPAAVVRWMSKELLHESDNTLCEAYVEVLRASSHHQEAIWETSASLNSIYKTSSLFEYNYKKAVLKAKLPAGVRHIVRVATFSASACDSFAPECAPGMTCTAFLDLALMNVDDQVKENAGLSLTILDSIEELLEALSDDAFERLIPGVVATFYAPSNVSLEVRCQSIIALPASTPRAYRLRRRLASECFATANDRKSTSPRNWPKIIVRALKDMPELQVNESTDFGLLMALAKVLDIAVSGGWTPYQDIIPGPPTGSWNKPAEPSSEEQQHNSDIDAICKGLRHIDNHIKTAGTTHMKRVQAKTAIEDAINRLENSVRARPKPKKSIFSAFGGATGGMKQATFGQGTFVKTESKSVLSVTPETEPKPSTTRIVKEDADAAAGTRRQSAHSDGGADSTSSPIERIMVDGPGIYDGAGDNSTAETRESSHETQYYDAYSQIQEEEDDSKAHNDIICQ